MIRSLLAWLAVLAAPAMAETARVLSGEHADFTRLVVELPAAADWRVGRTAMGYGFVTIAGKQPGYELSGVWDRIPRSRLQALRADPESGALLLTLACDCHVFPFEVQPGVVVLDIRNGQAPPGSAFEAALAPADAPRPGGQAPRAGAVAAYDWLDLPRLPADTGSDPFHDFLGGRASVSLAPLRDELLLQLSRGAAEGVVDMVLPGKPAAPEAEGMGDLSGALIRIGEIPGLVVGGPTDRDGTPDDRCFAPETVDLALWGAGRPPSGLVAEARSGLYGEFDTVSPEALHQAVRLHLYLGFGAEAAQYASLLPGDAPGPDLGPLLSLARLVDGDPDPASPFLPMLGCDGPAALWAALARQDLPEGAGINTDAIVRSFQMLPPHLRRHLGPRLASLLLAHHAEAARMIRDAIERTPDVPAGTVALIDAEAHLEASRPAEAMVHAEAAVREDASGLPGLVALVEAHFQSGTVLPPEVAASLLSLRDVVAEDVAQRDRALILALALSGQTDEAFALAGSDHPDLADLWRAVVLQTDDNALLAHAVRAKSEPAPAVAPETGLAIAVRLSGLGFPEAALAWLGPVDPVSPPERRLAAAGAELALGNARGTLELLSGLTGPEAQALQASAYQQLGAYDAARRLLTLAGKTEEGLRVASWGNDWERLTSEGTAAWAAAASRVLPAPADVTGPLSQGRAALEDSSAARAAIEALLADGPAPSL
jgi:hypothetical protein